MRSYGVEDLSEFSDRLTALRSQLVAPSEPGEYVAYTDGACFGNPKGNGGWAALVFRAGEAWQLFGHLSSTSNNRAEALGVLAALEWVPAASKLRVHSDSELTVRQLQGRYKIKANTDVWEQIQLVRSEKRIELLPEWVRGHAGDPLNERADQLSKLGALNGKLDDLGQLDASVPEEPSELAGVVAKTDWERDFVVSVRDQLRRGRSLSDKQHAVLNRMRSRTP